MPKITKIGSLNVIEENLADIFELRDCLSLECHLNELCGRAKSTGLLDQLRPRWANWEKFKKSILMPYLESIS